MAQSYYETGQLQQLAAMQNARNYGYGGLFGGTAQTTGTAVTMTQIYDPAMNQYQSYIGQAYATMPQPEPTPKKYKNSGVLLKDLRNEIDTWHGDILRAA